MADTAIRVFFKAYRTSGEQETGYLDASTEEDAIRQLTSSGRTPFLVRRVDASKAVSGPAPSLSDLFRPRLDLPRFFGDLSVMLGAGFTVDIALKAVADATADRRQKALVEKLHGLITEGKSVSQAFRSLPEIPPDVVALVSSGESGGKLDVVVARLSKDLADRTARNSQIIEALLYPAFLVVVMIGALLVLSLYLVPALTPIFENAGVPTPAIVRILAGIGSFMSEFGLVLMAALVAAVLLFAMAMRRGAARAWFADLAAALPVTGRFVREATVGRYLSTMGLLLANGVTMLEAMQLAAQTALASKQRSGLMQSRLKVSDGEPFWRALGDAGLFSDSIMALIRLGEESNNLAPMMERAAAMTQGQLQRRISRLLTFLTPAITIGLGAVVGGLIISVMSTLLSINDIAIR